MLRSPLRALLASMVALTAVLGTGGATAADLTEGDLRLFTRMQSGCSDEWLDPEPGDDAGCWFLLQPGSEAYHHLGNPMYTDFTTLRLSSVLDASRPLTGTVRVGYLAGRGAGLDTLDVDVSGRVEGSGSLKHLGSTSITQPANPLGSSVFTYSVDLPESLHGLQLTELTLRLEIRGATAPHAYPLHAGRTFLDLPVLVETEDPATIDSEERA